MNSGRAVKTLLALVVFGSAGVARLAAQETTALPAPKIPVLAGALEWLTIPTIGYAYAGDWSRGIPSALVRLTGFALVISAMEEESWSTRGLVGVAMLGGGTVFAIVDAGLTARRENRRRMATQSSISVIPDFGDGRVGVRVRVALGR